MWRWLIALAFAGFVSLAWANGVSGPGLPSIGGAPALSFAPASSGATYTGPGDTVSGATLYTSCTIAYNAAYATAHSKACNFRRASDNTTCDFDFTSAGTAITSDSGCSVATGITPTTFATTDVTCTSATASASTTITVSGCSGTPNLADTMTGTGVTSGPAITAVSVAAGSGTITVSRPQTITAVAITLTWALYVTEQYDQSGNGNNTVQATAGNQPQYQPNGCFSASPCVWDEYGTNTIQTSATLTDSQPFTYSGVFQVLAQSSAGAMGTGNAVIGPNGSANTWFAYAGGSPTYTVADATSHAIQAVFNGGSSIWDLDGTATTGQNFGTNGNSAPFVTVNTMVGWYGLAILYPSALTTTQANNLCHVEYTLLATGTAC